MRVIKHRTASKFQGKVRFWTPRSGGTKFLFACKLSLFPSDLYLEIMEKMPRSKDRKEVCEKDEP